MTIQEIIDYIGTPNSEITFAVGHTEVLDFELFHNEDKTKVILSNKKLNDLIINGEADFLKEKT